MESMGMRMTAARSADSDEIRITTMYGNHMPEADIVLMNRMVQTIRTRRGITVEELAETVGTGYAKAFELTVILETDGIIVTDLLQRCSINPKNM